jgi:hypothetical protein
MVVGNVGADEKDDVGVFHIGIRAGRTVRTEGELVAGYCRGHAQRGIAVVVSSAKAKLYEFAKGVALLCEELTCTDYPERFIAVALLNVMYAGDHCAQGFIPRDWHENAVFAEKRLAGATGRVEDVVFGEPLGAQLASINRMVGIATYSDCLVPTSANEHAATDGAISAGGFGPLLCHT